MKKLIPVIALLGLFGCASTFQIAWQQNNAPGSIDHFVAESSTDLSNWAVLTNYPGSVGPVTNTVSTLPGGTWWLRVKAVGTNGITSDPSNVVRADVPNAPQLFKIVIIP